MTVVFDPLPRIPTEVRSFEVRCRIGQFVMDGDDEGRTPDLAALGGTVTIEPDLRKPVRINSDNPLDTRVVGVNGIEFQIDPATGILLHPDGQPGVELVDPSDPHLDPQGWTYTATVKPAVGRQWAVTFGAPTDGSRIVNIGGLAGVEISPGTGANPVQQVVAARDEVRVLTADAEEAATLASGHAAAADASATYAAEVAYGQPLEATDAIMEQITMGATATAAALDRTYRRGYSVKEFGAIGNGAVDDTAAIQAAADAAFAANGDATLYFPEGTYRTTGTLRIRCQIDGRAATISYRGTGTALIVGTDSPTVLFRKSIWLPRIINQTALTAGAFDGTSIGARLINLNTCQIGFDFIQGFEEGLICEGYAQGWVHNTMTMGSLWGNHRNLILRPTTVGAAIGWVNSNLFLNGRLSLNQGWGVLDDPACSQIVLETPTGSTGGPNSNTWINTSVEGRQADQYRVKIAGRYNQFINCRWENDSGNTLRVLYQADAAFNEIRGGYMGMDLVEVWAATAGANTLIPAESAIEARAYATPGGTVPPNTPTVIVWTGFNGYKATHDAGVVTPRPGRWQVNATVAAQSTTSAGYFDIKIVRNDGTVLGVERYDVRSTTMRTYQVSIRENFTPGQTFHIAVQQATGADMAINTTARYSRLQMELLR